jgi:hypothetical protein
VEYFLDGVYPKKFGLFLKNLGLQKIQPIFTAYLTEYKKSVGARKTLSGYGVRQEAEVKASDKGKKGDASTKLAGDSKVAFSAPKKEPKSVPVCYGCNKPGHIRTNCSAKKLAEATAVKSVRQGAWTLSSVPRESPYLSVDMVKK